MQNETNPLESIPAALCSHAERAVNVLTVERALIDRFSHQRIVPEYERIHYGVLEPDEVGLALALQTCRRMSTPGKLRLEFTLWGRSCRADEFRSWFRKFPGKLPKNGCRIDLPGGSRIALAELSAPLGTLFEPERLLGIPVLNGIMFLSAELEIVPAGRARDCGLDRSMILSYGQDDRVCAFTSLFAMLDVTEAKRTGCCLLVDKEEIGSVGATGMHSRFFENTVAELIAMTEGESDLKVRRALMNSRMLSSDVSAAYDPMFAEAFEKRSSAFFANGITFNKFTGSRGKSGSNDANAEYIAALRNALDDAGVAYQFAELGRVDVGGGGTIAYIMANYGMEVIDSGVAVLNMHAPYEVTSKADVYEAVKGYRAFLNM